MDTTTLINSLKLRLAEYKIIRNHFQNKLDDLKIAFQNPTYVKTLSKLSEVDSEISGLERSIKTLRKQKRKELFVNLSSRVKLVSMDFEVTLWVDAKNISNLIGKRVGEIVELYNSKYKVAGIY